MSLAARTSLYSQPSIACRACGRRYLVVNFPSNVCPQMPFFCLDGATSQAMQFLSTHAQRDHAKREKGQSRNHTMQGCVGDLCRQLSAISTTACQGQEDIKSVITESLNAITHLEQDFVRSTQEVQFNSSQEARADSKWTLRARHLHQLRH